ncbi:hypothetical protein DL96DRAFT_1685263 [Flagelloscypha sp. PMI_526]|nr:hypothetical protein DL96DRAFT_1685263 [Flagelloscypha sp. PMI_526]
MALLPPDVLSEILRHSNLSTALRCGSLSRTVLPIAQKRIYDSIILNEGNFASFLDRALPLLRFTRFIDLSTFRGFDSLDLIRFFRAILDHDVLEGFEYNYTQIRKEINELIFQVSNMSSLQWFGLKITSIGFRIDEFMLSLLLTPKLRRLSLNLFAPFVIPGLPRGPLPLLNHLNMRDYYYPKRPIDLLKGSASWLSLGGVRRLEMAAGGAHFPDFPLNNQLEEIALYSLPNLDSFLPSLTRFSRLNHVIISAVRMDGLERLVENISDSSSSFTVAFRATYQTLVDWSPITERLEISAQNHHRFLLWIDLNSSNLQEYLGLNPAVLLSLVSLRTEFHNRESRQTFLSWEDLQSFLKSEC